MDDRPDPGSFAEARRVVLEAIEHSEVLAREQAARIVSEAEDQARAILDRAEKQAAEIEAYRRALIEQMDVMRKSLAEARERAQRTLQALGQFGSEAVDSGLNASSEWAPPGASFGPPQPAPSTYGDEIVASTNGHQA